MLSRNFILRITSIIYLALPNLIFLNAWIKPQFSLVLTGLLLYVFVKDIWMEEIRLNAEDNLKIKPFYFIILTLISLGLCLCFGIGEFRTQSVDWGTNNFKIHDLVSMKLPTFYSDTRTYPCYYWAYYLPTALFGKLVGVAYCRYAILAWSWIGISLILFWLFDVKKSMIFVLLFLLFNNANMILFVIDSLNIPYFEHFIKYTNVRLADFNLNFWSPMISSLQWVPQHLIPAGIVTLFIMQPNEQKHYKSDLFIFASIIMWSPLVCVGMVPIILAKLWKMREKINLFGSFGRYVLIILPFIPGVLYLSATNLGASKVNKFIWNSSPYWLEGYITFLVANIFIWIFLLRSQLLFRNPYLIAALISFCTFSLYRMGLFNDLMFRGIIPSSFVLGICIVTELMKAKEKSKKMYVFYMILFLYCSFPLFYRIYKGSESSDYSNTIEQPFTKKSHNTIEYLVEFYGEQSRVQYSLRKDSFFERHLIRK